MYVIGIVGPFGSGCSYIANLIQKQHGYEYISLSAILREIFRQDKGREPTLRNELQDYGDEIRKTKGKGFLAIKACEIIQKNSEKNYVVDSIRNPSEVNSFRSCFPKFFLFGIFAEQDVRWSRVSDRYNDDHGKFILDDIRDSGETVDFGQQVTETFRSSDIIILNNTQVYENNDDYKTLCLEVKKYIDIIEDKIAFKPSVYETCMAMAYAVSMRSSCLKRHVGAVIVDAEGNIFSSGYNEVPSTQRPCISAYGICYRDKLKKEFKQQLVKDIAKKSDQDKAYASFKKSFKILDYCKSLHAEENAILNVARIGASSALKSATLYTSTYPCNLCANKIAQVGIKEVVYFEPYPMPEAKKILTAQKVIQTPFKGVTYNGYFRLMEVVT